MYKFCFTYQSENGSAKKPHHGINKIRDGPMFVVFVGTPYPRIYILDEK